MTVTSGSAYQAADKRQQKKNQENEEQELRDAGRCDGDTGEAKNRGDDCHHEKRKRPTKHVVLLNFVCGDFNAASNTYCLRGLQKTLNTCSFVFLSRVKPDEAITAFVCGDYKAGEREIRETYSDGLRDFYRIERMFAE
jgi:hypothetical protein